MSVILNPALSILTTGSLDAYKEQQAKPNILTTPREEGGFDLIAATRQVLMDAGLGENIAHFDNNHHIQGALHLNYQAQRFILNGYFRIQLMSVPGKSSTNERFNLIDTGSAQDWLRLFQQFVLPFLIENNLPKTI